MEEHFWMLLSLKFSDEASVAELEELDALLKQQPELFEQYEFFRNLWENKKPSAGSIEEQYNRHLQRLSNYLSAPALQYQENVGTETVRSIRNTTQYKRLIFSAAAALIIVVSIFLLKKEKTQTQISSPVSSNTITTKPGSKSKVELPDGTLVWLNADSKLVYDENFSGATREVQLSGEAYFEVMKDKEHPFIIHTKAIDIKVLGTVFNVRSYDNEKSTETSLIKGSVEVTIHNAGRKIVLKPNEKLIVQNSDTAVTADQLPVTENSEEALISLQKLHVLTKDSSAPETLWVKNKLVFDNESLEEIGLKIERWYDVNVTITNYDLKAEKFSGIFEDESLNEVLEALKLTGNFKYSIDKKDVTIEP